MKLPLPAFALLTGLLLALSWPPIPLGFLMLIAFIPLLYFMEQGVVSKLSTKKFVLWTFLALLIWQGCSMIWFFGMSPKNASLVCIINGGALAGLMSIPYRLFRKGKRMLAYTAWAALWVAYEYLHLHWDLSFPLLTLGNGFGMYPQLIQWYQFTGVLGGSVWLLIVNFLLYESIRKWQTANRFQFLDFRTSLLVIVLPIIGSLLLFFTHTEKGKEAEVLSIHSNIDCYNQKYQVPQQELIDNYMQLTLDKITPETEYIIWPENALTNAEWVESLPSYAVVHQLREKLHDYPNAKLITGAVIYESYGAGKTDDMPPYISYSETLDQMYYTYNAAFQVSQEAGVPLRTKKHLVPFEEGVPYPALLSFLRGISGSFGGFVFSTKKNNQDIFSAGNGNKVSPLICYETAFGATAASYARQGAQALFVILNEGWYRHWQGATQLAYISAIRAIETRRSIVRSSNQGVSCAINQRGEILERLDEEQGSSLLSTIQLNRDMTFYTMTGDYIGLLAILFAFLLTGYSFIGNKAPQKVKSPIAKRKVAKKGRKK